MPSAARLGDFHTCPLVNTNDTPHSGGPMAGPGISTVLIGGAPAAVVGDNIVCNGAMDIIARGSVTVLIGSKPAARQGDATLHGGIIISGLPAVENGG